MQQPSWLPKKRPIQPDDPIFDFFAKAPPIAELLPIYFMNGAEVEEITTGCKTCKTDALPGESRGELNASGPDSYDLFVVSICRQCRCMNHNLYRLSSDGDAFSITDISHTQPDRFVRSPRR